MELSKRFLWIIVASSFLSILLLLMGQLTESSVWGVLASRCLNATLFYAMLVAGVVLIAAVLFARGDDGSDQSGVTVPVLAGLIVAAVGMVLIWTFGSSGYFWRNIFSGPISIFGNYSAVIEAYSDLPPTPDIADLWHQDGTARVIVVLCGGAYLFLLSLISAEVSRDGRTRLLAFLFMATSGLLAVFAYAGDFAILLLLSALNVLLTIKFIKGGIPIYIPGIVLIASVVFHPVFALFALAMLFVRLSGALIDKNKPGIPLLMLIALIVLGVLLSLIESEPFVSIFRPVTTAHPAFGLAHLWGFANQMMMISHLAWLLALVTVIYMFVTARVKELHGILLGGWFIAASAYYLSGYSVYGWIFGYPGAAVVVFPAILWLAYFAGQFSRLNASRALVTLTVVNVLVTASLFAAVHSETDAMKTFSSHVEEEIAFDPKFNDGVGTLLLGIMFDDKYQMYYKAIDILDRYRQRYPAQLVGKYHHGWSLTRIQGRLIEGLDMLREVNRYLIDEGKLFWEFNYRIGKTFMAGHNAYLASTSLERAAAEKNTSELAYLLGVCYESIKAPDSMASKHIQSIELGDSSKENFYKAGLAFERMGDSANTLKYYEYGIEHYPGYIPNYEFVARRYFLNGMYDSLEALADHGLEYLGRSEQLEACMILVYHYTDRPEQRDSAYAAFMDYFRIYPEALYHWGVFLEENGLVYEGRKMQSADVTIDWLNLKATLTFYHYYKNHAMPDSARSIIDRFIELDTTQVVLEVLETVRRYDTILWPKDTISD